jgi:hypothetical protein
MAKSPDVTSFAREVLRFALDQDSLQNLVQVAAREWQLEPEHVIEVTKRMAEARRVRLYREGGADVDTAGLSAADLESEPLIWLEPTDETASALNRIAAALE